MGLRARLQHDVMWGGVLQTCVFYMCLIYFTDTFRCLEYFWRISMGLNFVISLIDAKTSASGGAGGVVPRGPEWPRVAPSGPEWPLGFTAVLCCESVKYVATPRCKSGPTSTCY